MNTTNCSINTFYRMLDKIVCVKINETEFLFMFIGIKPGPDEPNVYEIKKGPPAFECNLDPITNDEVCQVIDTLRSKVSGDWWQLLLLSMAENILNK